MLDEVMMAESYKSCHKKFHKIFGSGNNTLRQFLHFVNNTYSEVV